MSAAGSSPPPKLRLVLTPRPIAVCRCAPDLPLPFPPLDRDPGLWSVTRTPEEISIVCDEDCIPEGATAIERGWRAFKVRGPLDFALTGVVAGLTTPLADAGLPVFVLSTFDTDYLMVRVQHAERATALLRERYEVEAPE